MVLFEFDLNLSYTQSLFLNLSSSSNNDSLDFKGDIRVERFLKFLFL